MWVCHIYLSQVYKFCARLSRDGGFFFLSCLVYTLPHVTVLLLYDFFFSRFNYLNSQKSFFPSRSQRRGGVPSPQYSHILPPPPFSSVLTTTLILISNENHFCEESNALSTISLRICANLFINIVVFRFPVRFKHVFSSCNSYHGESYLCLVRFANRIFIWIAHSTYIYIYTYYASV